MASLTDVEVIQVSLFCIYNDVLHSLYYCIKFTYVFHFISVLLQATLQLSFFGINKELLNLVTTFAKQNSTIVCGLVVTSSFVNLIN